MDFKLFVSQKHFFCLMTHLFKVYVDKYESKLRQLTTFKPVNALISIKRLLAYSLYWTLYYNLEKVKSRAALFEKLC